MKAINSANVFEEPRMVSKKKCVSSLDKEPAEFTMDPFEEPGFFFRGAVFGFILCVPFWAVIFWFIT